MGRARPLLTTALGANPQIAVNRDCTLIAQSQGQEGVRLYSLEMSAVVRTLPAASGIERDNVLSGAVSVVDYSPDGRWMATAVWGAVQLRDARGAVIAVVPRGSSSNYCSVRFSRDGASLLVASSEFGLTRLPLILLPGGSAKLGAGTAVDPEAGFFIADLSRDGTRAILTSFVSGRVKLVWLDGSRAALDWNLPGAAGAAFVDHDREVMVNSLEFDHGALIELRDTVTGEKRRTLNYRHGAHAHVSPDGSWALIGVGGDNSYLLHTADWSPGPPLPIDVQGRGNQPAFSPDGRCIAVGYGDTVFLVRTADGGVLAHLQSPQGGTYLPGLVFSPDGTHLALWWENGQLTIWDLSALRGELAARGLDW